MQRLGNSLPPAGHMLDASRLALRQALASNCSRYIVFLVIKGWLNAWPTSHRMHETCRRTCILGYPGGPDTLDHDYACHRFDRAFRGAVRSTNISCLVPFCLVQDVLLRRALAYSDNNWFLGCVLYSATLSYSYNVSPCLLSLVEKERNICPSGFGNQECCQSCLHQDGFLKKSGQSSC